MKIKFIEMEDFVNYKKCSMFIGTAFCNWKCCKEAGVDICQNLPLATEKTLIVDDKDIVRWYMNNELTEAIVFGGLEPIDQIDELLRLIDAFRKVTEDDIVIYTGYNESEIAAQIEQLKAYKNIIVKFGRFIPNDSAVEDAVLGVTLASHNQYAKRIS